MPAHWSAVRLLINPSAAQEYFQHYLAVAACLKHLRVWQPDATLTTNTSTSTALLHCTVAMPCMRCMWHITVLHSTALHIIVLFCTAPHTCRERVSELSEGELSDLMTCVFREDMAQLRLRNFQSAILNHGDARNHAHLHMKV